MSRPLHVLLVDDNPEDRGLVERELRKAFPGVRISEAIDQAQLDQHVEAGDYDLVITDYHLQWSNGMQVLKAVKLRAPHCPVIMFTATGTEEIAVAAMKHGLDDYIIKNMKHLVRLPGAIQTVLEHAQAQRQVDELATRLESLLTQLQVGVFSCSPEGRFLNVNDTMSDLLKYELHVDTVTLKSLFPDEGAGGEFLRDILASQEPREAELKLSNAPDHTKIYRLHARLVTARSGGSRIDGMLEDITRRKQSEADAKDGAIAAAQIAMLSPREKEVFQHVVAGRPNKSIARQMDIAIKTVEKHRASLMNKLRVRTVADLVRLATLAERTTR